MEDAELFTRLYAESPGFISLMFLKRDAGETKTVQFPTAEHERAYDVCLNRSHNGWDCYLSPATLAHRVPKGRGRKNDFLGSRALWVDLDVDDTHDKDDLLAKVENWQIPPSAIVDSGHGLHVYWLLTEFVDDKDRVERCNLWLADEFGADHCYSIDHLLRVPGTVNYK